MLVPIRKSYLSQQVRILSYTFSVHLLMTVWCNTTVGFIDNEIVGPNPGHYRLMLLHYRVVITLSGDFITLSGSYYITGRLLHYRL